jgi:hypothetical protein
MVANAMSEWTVAEQWSVGVHLQYEMPLAHTGTVVTAGVFVLYELK